MMLSWKLGPALAAGNTVILKPSEFTPLTALLTAKLSVEAGFPPGVINVINGYGSTVGHAISHHMHIEKVAFTGSTIVGRKVLEASAKTNLKETSLELGGKSPNIIFDDCDMAQAVEWTIHGILYVLRPFIFMCSIAKSLDSAAGTTDRRAALAPVYSSTKKSTTSSCKNSQNRPARSSSATPSAPTSTRVLKFLSSNTTCVPRPFPFLTITYTDLTTRPTARHGIHRLRQAAGRNGAPRR